MGAERSHPPIRSLIDGNEGRAGWINEFNDVPGSQSSLSPIELSAAPAAEDAGDTTGFQERTAGSSTPVPLAVFW